jgi:hypothetical protein
MLSSRQDWVRGIPLRGAEENEEQDRQAELKAAVVVSVLLSG